MQKDMAIQKLKARNKLRINTKFTKKDIKFKDEYPIGRGEEGDEERKVYKYNCPICLRYFNHILVSTCCNNYICRYCIGCQAKKALSDDKYVI